MNRSGHSGEGDKVMDNTPLSPDGANSRKNPKPDFRSGPEGGTSVARDELPDSAITHHESRSDVESQAAQVSDPRDESQMDSIHRTSVWVDDLPFLTGLEGGEGGHDLCSAPAEKPENRTESQIGAASTVPSGSDRIQDKESDAGTPSVAEYASSKDS